MPDETKKTPQINVLTDEMVQQYKDCCIKWGMLFQQLPFRAAQDVLRFFTPIRGLRGKMRFGSASGRSQYSPFKKRKNSGSRTDLEFREIETLHANVIDPYSPVDYIDLPMSYDDPIIGEAIKKGGTVMKNLILWAAARGEGIAQAAFTGEYDADGDTSEDMCDGILTIADKEVTAGNLSAAKGNYIKITDKVTKVNAVDVAKEIVFSSNHFLRRQDSFMLCSTDFADKYNESYLLTHSGIPYNDKYDQPWVEGGGHKLTLIPLPELNGTNRAIITNKANLLHGFYNDTDATSVDIMRKDHYEMSIASDIWIGFQIHTIDPRRFRYVEFAEEEIQEKPTQNENQGGEEQDDEVQGDE